MERYKTPIGDIEITVFGHASLLIRWNGKNIYVDPYSEVKDYAGMDKADLILITHNHYDHFDKKAIAEIEKPETHFIVSENVGVLADNYELLKNGDTTSYDEIAIHATFSYNVNRRDDNGNLFHPKGVGNGYILSFGSYRLYIAGDTEPIPEMKFVTNIDIAFLPKNLPYTMTDEEFVQVANMIKPKYLYPIHYFEIDIAKLKRLIDTGITMIVNNK